MTLPFAMTWARRVELPDPPSGRYDAASQGWLPSVLRPASGASGTAAALRVPTAVRRDAGAVVIFTRKFDPHSDVVVDALNALQVPVVRVNGESLTRDWSIEWRPDGSGCTLRMLDEPFREVSLTNEVRCAYYRRSLPLEDHPEVGGGAAARFAEAENESLLRSLYAYPSLPWLSPPHMVERARQKAPQLALATEMGLRTPRTIITNDPARARRFAENLDYNVIVKPLHSATLECEDEAYDLFTRRLSQSDIAEASERMRVAPVVLQEFLKRSAEIRVTIVGSDVFATSITTSLPSDPVISDRRLEASNAGGASYAAVQLPAPLAAVLLRLVRRMGLRTASIDLIRTSDGDYYFLELNPNGSWYWLELETGQPIAAAMARVLAEVGSGPAA